MLIDISNKFTIYCDIDATINNLIEYTLPLYNEKYQDDLKYDDITDYDITKFIKPECINYFEEFGTEEIFSKLSLEDGCKEILDYINTFEWIDFSFVTAAYVSKTGLSARNEWLKKHFDWYNDDSQFIRIKKKQKLKGHILIDDFIGNLIGGDYLGIAYSQPWSKDIDIGKLGVCRVDKWDDRLIDIINNLCIKYGFEGLCGF